MQSRTKENFLNNLNFHLSCQEITIPFNPYSLSFYIQAETVLKEEICKNNENSIHLSTSFDYSNYYYKTPTLILKIFKSEKKPTELLYEIIDKVIEEIEKYCKIEKIKDIATFNPDKENKLFYKLEQDNESQLEIIKVEIPIEFKV